MPPPQGLSLTIMRELTYVHHIRSSENIIFRASDVSVCMGYVLYHHTVASKFDFYMLTVVISENRSNYG